MKLKAIVFDCDGVIFDSKEANRAYYDTILKILELPPMTEEQLYYAHTHTVYEVIDYLIPDPILRKKAHILRKKIDYSQFIPYLKLEPNVKEVLALFKKSFKIGMATSRANTVYQLLDTYKLSNYFDIIISALDVKQVKPHPEALYKIMTYFSIKPEEMIYVGDGDIDAEMAKRAKVIFVAYKNKGLNSDFYIDNFLELLKIVK
ncbi:MAG: HAD family hydrolase [Candidatus Desulfofervidus auxilii]|nr:HAD family hydrolase [Candidatus Desulfofervidus auxilii]